MALSESALFFYLSFQLLILHFLMSVCTQFRHLFLGRPRDYNRNLFIRNNVFTPRFISYKQWQARNSIIGLCLSVLIQIKINRPTANVYLDKLIPTTGYRLWSRFIHGCVV
jgi:hypothetical protein